MRVILLNTMDRQGGAARACFRLMQGLLIHGVDAHMLVQDKTGEDEYVLAAKTKLEKGLSALRPTMDQVPLALRGHSLSLKFSSQWFPDGLAANLKQHQPDLVNLHWINKGFVRIETLPRLAVPLVWTLHDMWPFTGGCYHSGECENYRQQCGACPILDSSNSSDLSHWVWRRKQRSWQEINLTVVCPSKWIAQRASQSSLFASRRIEVIANGLDTGRYRPLDRAQARDWLGLPQDKLLLLFAAAKGPGDLYKGFKHIPVLMERLRSEGMQNVELVVLGEVQRQDFNVYPFQSHLLGQLSDDVSIALAYAASDVFLSPSTADNLPNTVMEAMACGIPGVAFRVGGIPEMIDHQLNGYLAEAEVVDDLAAGVQWVLEIPQRRQVLAEQARLKARREYDHIQQASKYHELFQELVQQQWSPHA
jgi:glycosyltransferase involved in cell wall biosynthesis